jgi:ribosomal protein S18 acetylase RimI-like enzyme|tara:strand:+ start:178 stop:369 length:192 start_codon:yes stop_codon:yes gene_type:complete
LYRGASYGKQALSSLEHQLKAHGLEQIKLRIAYHNERAPKLYQAVGFSITGFYMSKKIGAVEA